MKLPKTDAEKLTALDKALEFPDTLVGRRVALRQIVLGATLLVFAVLPAKPAATPAKDTLAYTNDGSLVAPAGYREWIFLTSGIDMNYAAAAPGAPPPAHSVFDNVFVNPASYISFVATGTWPDKTTFVLEIRSAEDPVSINKRGHTQSTEIRGVEIHVKDKGKWYFYDLGGNEPAAKLIPPPASCYTCHEAHGAVDTTFVQFYPTLLPLAQQKKTLSPEYLKQLATPSTTDSPSRPQKKLERRACQFRESYQPNHACVS